MSTQNTPTQTADLEIDEEDLQKNLESIPPGQEGVLPALISVQEMYGYLPEQALEIVADEFDTPLADVLGVATFYSHFSLEPQGEHTIRVCTGTACHVNGADDVTERLMSGLNVKPGEVTEDNQFTLTTVRCVGACGLAPVVMVDDDVHGGLEPDDVPEIIEEYNGEGE